MMHPIKKVTEFHAVFGHPIATVPTIATQEVRQLRVKLAAEELIELACALGVNISIELDVNDSTNPTDAYLHVSSQFDNDDDRIDLVEAADALADSDYINSGTALVLGVPLEACVAEVHRSNMSKADLDGKAILRDDGKILKGPNYSPPNIKLIIDYALIEGTNYIITPN